MPFPFVFRFFFFLMVVAWDFADLTVSSSSLYEDFFHCFSFGGSLSTIAAGGSTSPGGLWDASWEVDEHVFLVISFLTGRFTA